MPPRQLRLHTLRLSALPFFRSLLGSTTRADWLRLPFRSPGGVPLRDSTEADWNPRRPTRSSGLGQLESGQGSRVRHPRVRVTPVPHSPTASGMLLWGTLVSNNLTWLEWTQIDRPRALKLSVSIESVK